MDPTSRMQNSLSQEYNRQDWHLSLRAGPEALGVLGQCQLFSTRPELMSISLSGPGLEYGTLHGNIYSCVQLGLAAFKEAEKEMIEIAYLADSLASPGDADRDEKSHADLYLEQAQQSIDDCMSGMENVQQKFEGWSKTTLYLSKALGESQGKKAQEAKDVKRDIRENEASKNLQEVKLASELRMFESRKESLEKSREQKQFFENLVPALASSIPGVSNISALYGSLAGSAGSTTAASTPFLAGAGSATSPTLVGLLPLLPQAAISGAIGYCFYSYLKWEVLTMEEVQAKRQAYINEVTEEISAFQATLKDLSAEAAEITEILKKSVYHLTELQYRVQDFMDILLQLSRFIKRTVRDSRLTIETAAKSERLANAAVNQDLRENAFKMKASFNFLLRATNIYVEVSTNFITPTIRKFGDLRLYEATSEADINEKLEALNQLRLEACEGAVDLAIRMHRELKRDIHEIVANSNLLDH
ncbi:hypothetical protein IFM58399_07325 [Aspergillus lentulus]|uniref:uncharacterized protein n=1 Tax=Aspergillus lentulus TaxID=293939 RepID=UPI001392532D|nr:uncharacterized protein IFM58399_07325 [Aspergillus lentulus]GFF44571.1 hypothetical protein IFM58399_07325 [Aspergillus lentulus]GFF68871.1 hypothetical protein IFM62136_07420 [Aspergillus lentulus]